MPKSVPRSVKSSPKVSRAAAKRGLPTRRRDKDTLMGFPLQRVWHIHAQLAQKAIVTGETLAKELDISSRTAKRDIRVMRDRLEMPIAWDDVRHTYYYTRECVGLPFVVLGPREALVLALAGRVSEAFYGSSFGQSLDDILNQLAPVMGGAVSFTADDIDQVIATPAPDHGDEFEHFFPLFDAIRTRREVRLLYTKREQDEPETRILWPLRLTCRRSDNRWLLVALDPGPRELRKFLLHRIQEIAVTETAFESPAGVDVDTYLRASLDAFAGDKVEEVRVALDERAAFYAREQPWHPSQRLRDLPDGRVELTIRVNDLPGAKNLILHWAEHVEVLAPATLRAEVREAHRAALAKYDRA